MYKEKTFLAIIPARGGSKRLPKKNILDLNGNPLISYSIQAGLYSKYIDNVIVSSDNTEILDISKKYGAEIIKRPDFLSNDTATSFNVVKHTLENVKKFDFVILLQPTSPLRNSKHIDEAIKLLHSKNADAIISVCETEHNPLWSNTLPNNNCMDTFLRNELKNKRSQDLKKYYRINGAIYVCKYEKLLKEESFFLSHNIFAYIMNRKNSIDIDCEFDFQMAEYIMKKS